MAAKLADVTTKLLPHQQRVVDRLMQPDQRGLVAVHGLGSGKTLTSIAAHDAYGGDASIVVPAALKANYLKEQEKHLDAPPGNTNMMTLQTVARRGTSPRDPFLVVDEAHRLRDAGSKGYKALSDSPAEKRLLLTGSPFYNHPADIAPLINIASGEKTLAGDRQGFEKQYIIDKKVNPGFLDRLRGVKPGSVQALNPKREKDLRDVFSKYVDYHKGGGDSEFPDTTTTNINVPMSRQQQRVYDSLMGQAPPWVAAKIRKGLPPSKQEAAQLNAFMSAARQASNTTAPFQTKGTPESPKIQRAFEELKKNLDANPQSKAVVFSNFLEAGINPYKQQLDTAKIPYGEFTGAMKPHERDELIRNYNEGKVRALLLSSAGGEGLDLKGTRLMQILEPHWNEEKLKQVIGRGVRYKSHEGLPEDQRNVEIQRFLATRTPSGIMERLKLKKPGGAVDEYLRDRSADKERLLDQFRALMPQEKTAEAAIEKKHEEKVEPKKEEKGSPLYERLVATLKHKPKIDPEVGVANGYYSMKTKKIVLGDKDVNTLAHELGHAELAKKFTGKLIQNVPARIAYHFADWGGAAAGAFGPTKGVGAWLSAAVPAFMAAPTVASEAAASVIGHNKLKEVGATKLELETYKNELLRSGATYLVNPAVGLAYYGVGRGIRAIIAHEEAKSALRDAEYEKARLEREATRAKFWADSKAQHAEWLKKFEERVSETRERASEIKSGLKPSIPSPPPGFKEWPRHDFTSHFDKLK